MRNCSDFVEAAKCQPDSEALLAYIQKEITLCRDCQNANCSGITLDVAGVKRRAAHCHSEIGKVHAGSTSPRYTDYDIQLLKRMMDIRKIQIDRTES
ncbi:MAG: hypothetical protein ACLSVG_07405 [Clostridia bacterium]